MTRLTSPLATFLVFATLAIPMAGCHTNRTALDSNGQYDSYGPALPPFIQNLLTPACWSANTICTADGKAFFRAIDNLYRTTVIYDDEGILLENPAVFCDSVSPGEKYKFWLFAADKEMIVDFRDPKSLEKLAKLDTIPASFTRFRKDTVTGRGGKVMFSLCADFMRPGERHAATVNPWIAQMAEQEALLPLMEETAEKTVAQRPVTSESDKAALARRAAEGYFNILRIEEAEDLNGDIGWYFRDVCLRAWHVTGKYVTMLKYTHNYTGGAHGYYTEELVTCDTEGKRIVDWDFLFRPECQSKVLDVFHDAVSQNTKYQKYCSDYSRSIPGMFTLDDGIGGDGDRIKIPRPGLGEKGVVFSFQPYQLSGYPDGTFHITVPYGMLKPYLTDRARRLLGMDD